VRELALPYTGIDAGGKFGIVDTPDYAALNPNRQIPLIDDGGFLLWESNANRALLVLAPWSRRALV
jgi:glutathione S-transferase